MMANVLKKALKLAVFLTVAAVLIAGGALTYVAHTRLPGLDRVVEHPSLQAGVRVARDEWGVPHIKAETEADAYFALGYVMAQDRLFQMEMLRRFASGELAAWVGASIPPLDKVATLDAVMRSFRLRKRAEAFFRENAAAYPELVAAAEAFVAGINHCIEVEPAPFEFVLLQATPRPFTPADCLTVAAVLPITFADGLREDPLASMLQERHPDMDIDVLFPGYHKEVPVTIMETLDEAEAYLAAKALEEKERAEPPKAKDSVARMELVLAPLQTLSKLFGPAMGSNSWVLGPSRTASGMPILANDPHIGFTNPSIWYEAHLRYGDYDLYAYHLPLIPFALIGHNKHHAWGMTMFANDDVDLYRETFDSVDPNKVLYRGEWVDVETEEETIQVRFGEDLHYTVRVTPHGPILTDPYRMLLGYEGADIALSWVWQHVEYTDMVALYRMGHAQDYEEFAAAIPLFTSPGINISYADADGNIAWWAAGKIPVRPRHVNPKQLLDGASGEDEILGYVPCAENPHLKNPPCGFIVTANNKSTVKPVGEVPDLQGYWQPADRSARMEELLSARSDWSLEALKAVQLDDRAYAALPILRSVSDVLRFEKEALTPVENAALLALAKWDRRHNVDSVGASIYEALCRAILRNALVDEMGETLLACYGTVADHWNFFKYLMQQPESPFWDDLTTPEPETKRDIVVRAFKEAVATLRQATGRGVNSWKWGTVHTLEFKHPLGYVPLLGHVFNIGPFPAPGGAQVINNMLWGSSAGAFDVVAGPSTRRLIDFADPEHSLSILPTGNSGQFLSPHYDDQAAMFMAGQYREPHLTPEQIEAHTRHVMRFVPSG